ncbi:MAG: DUF5312 family protein [Treponema sp.]
MEEKKSTFESLVASLSEEETKKLLFNISNSMQNVQTELQETPQIADDVPKAEKATVNLTKEPFFLRIWLTILSLIKSIPVESLYQKELVNRIGRDLKDHDSKYINISKQLYTSEFYKLLSNLRKTQVFFSSMLDCYNSDKNNFYMLLSSFVAPYLYDSLIKISSSFDVVALDTSNARKNTILKEIEKLTTELDTDIKAEMYKVSRAIEWMRTFCDFSLDKVLLKFSVQPSESTCSIFAIQNEIELLASVLASSKNIPIAMLQTLFLLCKKDVLPLGKDITMEQKEVAEQNANKFIDDALKALSYIDEFKKNIPMKKIVKYVKQDITWVPIAFSAGEDWFLYFKHAWKDLFLQEWNLWVSNIQKEAIKSRMLQIVEAKALQEINYKPWRKLLEEAPLKNETILEFFKTFFQTIYPNKFMPTLKIIISEGAFYRTDNLSEYTSAFNSLNQTIKEITSFENELSPESIIGTSFASIIESGVLTIKTKTQMETLIRNIESDIKRICTRILDVLKSMNVILTGVVGGSKTGIYATLTNWSSIQGNNNKKFQDDIIKIKETIVSIIDLINTMSSIE